VRRVHADSLGLDAVLFTDRPANLVGHLVRDHHEVATDQDDPPGVLVL